MRTGATASKAKKVQLPGPVYLDTSAFVKLYLPEPESDQLNALLRGRRDLVVSDLAVTEVISSLCRRHREGALDPSTITKIHGKVLNDMKRPRYRLVDLVPATHREAERLMVALKHVPLRASDALHLALAVTGGAMSVLTYDRRLAEAARAAGLNLIP